MLSYGDATYGYTSNGSLKYKAVNGDTTWYTYDLLGDLVNVLLPDGTFIEYLIDAQNRRIGKKVNGEFRKGWIYQDQINPVAELDSLGQMEAYFVYGTKTHVPDYMVKEGVIYSLVTDHLGSVRLVVDEAGNVVQSISYDEFGNVLSNSNPTFQAFAYAGGLVDEETGLVRFGARDYDAKTGRWTSKDPIGFKGGNLNVYLYCINDPINLIDPSGLLSSTEALLHYIGGSGEPLSMQINEIFIKEMSVDQLTQIQNALNQFDESECYSSDIVTNIDEVISYSTTGDQALFLGDISLHFSGTLTITPTGSWFFSGKLNALPDVYDFNKSTHRSKFGEMLTTIGRQLPGEPYIINITGEKYVTIAGQL